MTTKLKKFANTLLRPHFEHTHTHAHTHTHTHIHACTHTHTSLRRVQPSGGGTPWTSPPGIGAAAPPAFIDEPKHPMMVVAQHGVASVLGNYTRAHTIERTYYEKCIFSYRTSTPSLFAALTLSFKPNYSIKSFPIQSEKERERPIFAMATINIKQDKLKVYNREVCLEDSMELIPLQKRLPPQKPHLKTLQLHPFHSLKAHGEVRVSCRCTQNSNIVTKPAHVVQPIVP